MLKKIASALFTLFISGTPFIGSAQFSSSPSLTPIWGTQISLDPIWGLYEQKLGNSFTDPIWEPTVMKKDANKNTIINRYKTSALNDNKNINSSQQGSPIWNRQTSSSSQAQATEISRQQNDNQATSLRRRLNAALMSRDTLGRLMLDDSLIMLNGDSTSSGGSASGSINSDMDGIAPPPDDPVDAPIDGGLSILLAIGLVHGYTHFQRKSYTVQVVKCKQ